MATSIRVSSTASSFPNVQGNKQSVRPPSEERYAAKLLFQLRFDGDRPAVMRTVEERIVVLFAGSAFDAYNEATRKGKKSQRKFKNENGVSVKFEFIGVMDLMHLGVECEPDEVWYDIRRLKSPMERKNKIIPQKTALSAFKYEARKK